MASRLDALLADVKPAYAAGANSVVVWRPSSGLFISRVVGHFSVLAATAVTDALRKQVATDHRHRSFHDWGAMTDYDSSARVLCMDVARAIFPMTEEFHIFTHSPLVAFGVRAASLVVGRLTLHQSLVSFEAAAIAALERSPTSSR